MFYIVPMLALLMSVTVAAALGIYVIRSWKQLRADEPGSIQHEILDRLDRIEMRLEMLSERVRGGDAPTELGASARPSALLSDSEEGSTADLPPPDGRQEPPAP